MKKYMVYQSIDIDMVYFIEASSLEEAKDLISDGSTYSKDRVMHIEVLMWDRPYDVEEIEYEPHTLSEEQLEYWSNILY